MIATDWVERVTLDPIVMPDASLAGIDLLAEAGPGRIKICYEPDNPPARDLYLSVGFEPTRKTVVYSRRTSGRTPETGSAGA